MKNLPLIPVPFSPTKVRDRNADRASPEGHTERCLFCEAPMNPARVAYFVEMTTSNEIVPVGTTVKNSQGCFPVGSGCKNRVPEGYRITKAKEPSLWEIFDRR